MATGRTWDTLRRMAEVSVRFATAADAAEIARIQQSTWRTGYRDWLPEDVVALLDDPAAAEVWAETIKSGPAVVAVAVEGDWTAGFAAFGPAPADDLTAPDGSLPSDADRTGLIGTLLVEPRWGRRGHGGRLLTTALDWLREHGLHRAVAWVPESDSASLSFYRRAGWHPDGTIRTLHTDGGPLREIRLDTPVDPSPQP